MATISKHLLQNVYASRMLEVMKMKAVVPCEVDDRITGFKGTVTDVVFDALRIEETDAKYRAAGYLFDDDMHVIATTADDGVLVWGGANSVYHLRKGDKIEGFEDHMAFNDILHLTNRFRFKNKKAEVDALVQQLKAKYTVA